MSEPKQTGEEGGPTPPPYEECGFCQQGVIYGGTDREADCAYCGGSGVQVPLSGSSGGAQ